MLITIAFHEKPHGGQDAVRREQTNIQTDTKTPWNEQAYLVTWVTKAPKYTNSEQYHTCSARCSMWFFVKDVTRQRHMNNFSALYHHRFVSTNTSLSPSVPPKKVQSRNELSSLGRSISLREGTWDVQVGSFTQTDFGKEWFWQVSFMLRSLLARIKSAQHV